MITLKLDWREVLWWMQGGMAGSHLRWSVYEDMVNKVWPQCSEQERRNLWLIMRRDLGSWWRPDGWSGYGEAHGEGLWRADDNGYAIDHKDAVGKPKQVITDLTPWKYFRQVLARFDPENQYAVTLPIKDEDSLMISIRGLSKDSILDAPTLYISADGRHAFDIESHPTFTVRTYLWDGEYRIDWNRRCAEDAIKKAEKITIPDTGEM